MDVGERYVLGRLVGEGATAYVFEAEDTVLRREVAVKVFRDPDIGDTGSERVNEETRILAALDHPHLLQVYDSGRSPDGHRFIVMPLVRGTTLARRLTRGGPLAPHEAKRIGKALSEGLAHVHARGIVHRDVKPSNVLIAEDGTPYLADFGFAHAADSPALTATDCIVGTAGYLAPEQAEGLPVTPAVDVYALGLVLLEALTGERAYQGTPLERATANALRPPHIPAHLGRGWLNVLRAMTSRTPSARPAAAEVSDLLERAENELPEVSASDATMPMPTPAPWSNLPSGKGNPDVSRTAVASGRPRVHRRLAMVGATAAAAVAVLGVSADVLTSGASADTRVPLPMTPGAGAAGTPPTTQATVTVTPSTTPSTTPSSTPASTPATATTIYKPAAHTAPPAAKCGNGHGKHKCQGGGGDHEDH